MQNLHITAQQIRIVAAVGKYLSYTQAAQHLHLSQPAVSIQIKRLEDTNDIRLFEKIGRKLYLTKLGDRVYESCCKILEELNELNGYIKSEHHEITGELNLAIVTPAKYFMPYILKAFLNRYPDVTPKITVINRQKILDDMKQNQFDLIVMGRAPESHNMKATPFYENNLVVVAPPLHPLRKEHNIPLIQLKDERFLMREEGSGIRDSVQNLFNEHNILLTPYMELSSTEAVKQAVMAGLGISVLPQYAIRIEKRYQHLEILNVASFPIKRQWFIAHMDNKALTPVAEAFLEFIHSIDIKKLLAMSDTR
jgi:DNA-binding transcriptional LysR family regulator